MMSLCRRAVVWALLGSSCVWAITVVRAPYLQNVQSDRVSVLWTTRESGSGRVMIAPESGSPITVDATVTVISPDAIGLSYPAFYQYRADFSGLGSGVTYTYCVFVDGTAIASDPAVHRFRTASVGKVSFLAFGDSGEDTPQQKTLIELMKAELDISFAIHTGDLAYPRGDYETYDRTYFGLNAALMSRLSFFATPGNHDYMVQGGAIYLSTQAPPDTGVPSEDRGRYYSYDWGDIHVISLDSNSFLGAEWQRMSEWLLNDLEGTHKYWRVAFFHHPPYPTGHHRDDVLCDFARTEVIPILEKHGVQLVLSGHEHSYQRSYPVRNGERVTSGPSTTYVITAGGGAALQGIGFRPQTAVSLAAHHYLRVDIDGTNMVVRAIGLDGAAIDRFTLTPEPGLLGGSVVNSGDFSPAIAPGTLVSVFGENFSLQPVASTQFPLPSDLDGVRVMVGGKPVPLLFVSPQQINCQMPYSVSGSSTLKVVTANGTASVPVVVDKSAPAVLALVSGEQARFGREPSRPGRNCRGLRNGTGRGFVPRSGGPGCSTRSDHGRESRSGRDWTE